MGFSRTEKIRLGLGYTLLGAASIAAGQTVTNAALPFQGRPAPHIVRELRDPATGARWVVLANAENPAGPCRMLLAAGVDRDQEPRASNTKTGPVAVIHPGDRVTVEEHTAAADVYLEAIAVDRALPGACFRVRLKIGSKVVRAVALAQGRAALVPSLLPCGEARP